MEIREGLGWLLSLRSLDCRVLHLPVFALCQAGPRVCSWAAHVC